MVDYRPHIEPHLWDQIRPFVTTVVADAAGLTPYNDRELYAVVTPLAVWMHTRAGLPLEQDVALDPHIMDRFVMVGLAHYTKAGRGTMRSRLRRVSEALLPDQDEPARERPLPKSDRSRPYSHDDVGALHAWAHNLPRQVGRNACSLLALGFGAGLIGTEFGRLRCGNLIANEDGIDVRVTGDRPRTVPVLTDWASDLEGRAGDAPESYVFRIGRQTTHRNVITNFVERHRPPIPLQARRMRATWITIQLEAGTPIVAILNAAGFSSAEALDPFIRWTPERGDGASRLRLASAALTSR